MNPLLLSGQKRQEFHMTSTEQKQTGLPNQAKFIVGGVVIAAAVIYLMVSSIQASAQYFLTVEEVVAQSAEVQGRNLRVSGAVIGETIQYDPETLTLTFTIAHVPGDNKEIEAQGGLAQVLHNAANDPTVPRLQVTHEGPKPDLLQNEAQAIITGQLSPDGVFHADELLLKCPTKYEEAVPQQVEE
jgi:cytochrome c-type biogenesis protein CcmE